MDIETRKEIEDEIKYEEAWRIYEEEVQMARKIFDAARKMAEAKRNNSLREIGQ